MVDELVDQLKPISKEGKCQITLLSIRSVQHEGFRIEEKAPVHGVDFLGVCALQIGNQTQDRRTA